MPIIAVVVAVIIGVVAWYITSHSTSQDEESTSETSMQSDTVTGDVKNLLSAGRSLTCTFSSEGNSGTVYIDANQKRMRGDFVTQFEGSSSVGHIINNSEYMYTWSDSEPQGVRIPVPDDEDTPVSAGEVPSAPQVYNALEADYDYDCDAWRVDESMFSLPPDVEFIDIAEQFKQLQTAPGLDCSVCDQIEEPAKAQCLQSLGC